MVVDFVGGFRVGVVTWAVVVVVTLEPLPGVMVMRLVLAVRGCCGEVEPGAANTRKWVRWLSSLELKRFFKIMLPILNWFFFL